MTWHDLAEGILEEFVDCRRAQSHAAEMALDVRREWISNKNRQRKAEFFDRMKVSGRLEEYRDRERTASRKRSAKRRKKPIVGRPHKNKNRKNRATILAISAQRKSKRSRGNGVA